MTKSEIQEINQIAGSVETIKEQLNDIAEREQEKLNQMQHNSDSANRTTSDIIQIDVIRAELDTIIDKLIEIEKLNTSYNEELSNNS